MPLYFFKCGSCGLQERYFSTKPKCRGCGSLDMVRTPKPPSTRVVETLDNHVMSKRLEREADAERLYRDRARSDPRNNHKDDDIV